MSIKILTANGIDNTNIDGARDAFFNSGMRDGIVKGALNEGTFGLSSSNVFYLDTCELRIAGHRVVIDEALYKTFSNKPSTDTRYSFVAQIVVDDNSGVEFSTFVQSANTTIRKDNLYVSKNGAGTYQVEIGRLTLLTDGTITDIVRTIDIITGGSGSNGDYIVIGEVTTTMLDSGLDAEVDIENVTDENGQKKTNFSFSIPKTAGSIVNINGNQVANVNFTSDPQTQINSLSSSLDTTNTNLQNEISARQSADTDLEGAINDEISARQSADTNLLNKISDVEHVETIYDSSSSDSNINWGYTSGIQYGDNIGKDLSSILPKFKGVRVTFMFYEWTITVATYKRYYNDFYISGYIGRTSTTNTAEITMTVGITNTGLTKLNTILKRDGVDYVNTGNASLMKIMKIEGVLK